MRNVKYHTKLISKSYYLTSKVGKTGILLAFFKSVTLCEVIMKPSKSEYSYTEVIELTEYFGITSKTCGALYCNERRMLTLGKRLSISA